jgi:hypothetical protein
MSVVTDERLMAPADCGFGRADSGVDESDDVVGWYLKKWDETDAQHSFPLSDPCSLGLWTAMRAARPLAEEGGAFGASDLSMAPTEIMSMC